MSTLRVIVKKIFGRYLVVTNTVACGVLMGAGDMAAQMIEQRKSELKELDLMRTGRYTVFGLCLGPLNHVWYQFLDKILPHVNPRTVLRKIAMDQMVAGPVIIAAFFTGMGLLEGRKFQQGLKDTRTNFWSIYKIDLCVWPAAQVINFYWMPPNLRVLYVSGITFGWNTFLAYYRSNYVCDEDEQQHTTAVKCDTKLSPKSLIPIKTDDRVDKRKSNFEMLNSLIHFNSEGAKFFHFGDQQEQLSEEENLVIMQRTKRIVERMKL